MSETDGTDPAVGGEGAGEISEGAEDLAYFHKIEDVFLTLRGSPLMLTPADFRTASSWRRGGIPLTLVIRTIREVFARRQERELEAKVWGLQQCRRQVEAAWKEARELAATGERRRDGAPPLDVAARLAALAGALPAGLPGRDELVAEVLALEALADSRAVEEALGRLEAAAVEGLLEDLAPERRAALEAEVDRGLAALAARIPREEAERARRRLVEQRVRRTYGLPALSLFAPEAEG